MHTQDITEGGSAERRETSDPSHAEFRRLRADLRERLTPEQYRETIRFMHVDRFLESGAEIMDAVKDSITGHPEKSGDGIIEDVQRVVRERGIPFSRAQREILQNTAMLLGDLNKDWKETLTNTTKGEIGELTRQEVVELNNLVNGSEEIKIRLLSELGRPVHDWSDRHQDMVEIDLVTKFPAILVKVHNLETWKEMGFSAEAEGMYDGDGLGIYVFTQKRESATSAQITPRSGPEIDEISGHEYFHFLRGKCLVPAVNLYLAEKIGSGPGEDLSALEERMGMVFDHGGTRVSEKALALSVRLRHQTKNKDRGILNDSEEGEGNKLRPDYSLDDRRFWNEVQNEYGAYLENQGRVDIQGSLDFIPDALRLEASSKRGQISEQILNDFDLLHDEVVFYLNAGVTSKEVSQIIQTSASPEMALKRLKIKVEIDRESVLQALRNTENFTFRNFRSILYKVHQFGLQKELVKKMTPHRVAQIAWGIMREMDKESVQMFKIGIVDGLGKERDAIEVLEVLGGWIATYGGDVADEEKSEIVSAYEQTLALKSVLEARERFLVEKERASKFERKFLMKRLFLHAGEGRLMDRLVPEKISLVLEEARQFYRVAQYFSNTAVEIGPEEEKFVEKWISAGEGVRLTVEADVAKRKTVSLVEFSNILDTYLTLYRDKGLDVDHPYPGRLLADSPRELVRRGLAKVLEKLDSKQ